MMEEDLRALLTGSADVIAIAPIARINWGAHPQGMPLPGVILTVVDNAEGLVMNGPNGLFEGRVQIDCYAETLDQAKALARAIRPVLHGYRDTNFRLVTHVATRDSREGGANEPDRPHRVSMDFTTAWRA
ncbi:DUF3168 domain-containing protein [Pararhodobacter zhoushanensis]|uniref:DUF3168 domain-containing protein n=1 Tax=Pararhodobacter zhoushanensis TaxID=2479545 RepID=A0ABT3GYK5_9RHOB|nr:DUF3168 domain-containing protein [Pararhodobacter zhoushanensis]MCW1932613.1 DUF3168 domain-containing protein [Pararhodobacter zhoushanensis]